MKSKYIVGAFIVGALIMGYLYSNRATDPGIEPVSTTESISIELSDYSGSGQSGTASLSEVDGKAVIEISVSGYDAQGPQPAHIHSGLCPRIGPVIHKLSDVIDGTSTTTLNIPLNDVLSSGDELNINVHASYDDFKTYTACGDLKQ